ncbi:MAG: dTDP-4-dehydrorhamnose 3,5-epimerase family protein [Parcubacteria group bacterium]|nr:dTDP-4-dehydrorhamnose 3,5-epimerase family protein [Parcubacteria group bacterium]
MNSKNNIKLIDGGLAVDDRGTVRFVNDFDFNGVKRFYQVENHQKGFIRAWHGHKKEGKYVYVSSGAALVGVVDLKTKKIRKFILSDKKPQVLWIPPNHANGFMNLEDNTDILFFSTSTLKESADDDIRFPYDQWNIWEIEYR